jgi:hypothetical protein
MKSLLFTFMFLVLMGGMVATAQFRKIPAEVTEAFKDKYPATKNVAWRDKIGSFVVSFEMDAVKYEAKFSTKGEWLQTEKEIAEESLPAAVKDGYDKSKFNNWEVKTISEIENKEGTVQYRIQVKKNNLEKKNLLFDNEGRMIKDALSI